MSPRGFFPTSRSIEIAPLKPILLSAVRNSSVATSPSPQGTSVPQVPGTFVWIFPAYREPGLNVKVYYAHNDYLHAVSEMGLVVSIFLLWIICLVLFAGFRYKDPEKGKEEIKGLTSIEGVVFGGTIGILSLSLHGIVDFNFHITANMISCVALAAVIMREDSLKNRKKRSIKKIEHA